MKFYTIPETAALLGIHSRSVYRLINAKRLRAVDVGSATKSRARIPESEILRLAKGLPAKKTAA